MPSGAVTTTSGATDTRQRLIDIAVRLFTRHSFAGTSLQMIADEIGFTKAAVYHHFHTREELLGAVVEPLVRELERIIETAEALRSRPARAEHMLSGYVDLVVRNRGLMSVLAGDPGVIDMLRSQRDDLVQRQVRLLADIDPGPGGLVKAAVFGFLITLMGCYHGYTSKGGAQGVGAATTNAVVSASILILTFNYFITEAFFAR